MVIVPLRSAPCRWAGGRSCTGAAEDDGLAQLLALLPDPTSVWAMLWRNSCSSCARPASKSASVICGVVDGSVPPPVASGLSTVRRWIVVAFVEPVFVSSRRFLQSLLIANDVHQGARHWTTTPRCLAERVRLVIKRWPLRMRMPGIHIQVGPVGGWKLFV